LSDIAWVNVKPAIQLRAAWATPVLLSVLVLGCGCGSSAQHTGAASPTATASDTASPASAAPPALRPYLEAWEASWRRTGIDLGRLNDDDAAFSDTPDASWDVARRDYDIAAAAYRHDRRRLAALAAPPSMRAAHARYVAAVERQERRFQALADAFGGTDPQAMEAALEALEASQMEFDRDGVRWEKAVVAACKARGVRLPEIVRRELISAGRRTSNS
jgi:hypothetical protein